MAKSRVAAAKEDVMGRLSNFRLVSILGLAAVSCGRTGSAPEPQRVNNALVDNLYVIKAANNNVLLNYSEGVFRVRGRCLVLELGSTTVTPVFISPRPHVDVTKETLTLPGGFKVEYGRRYALNGLAGPSAFSAGPSYCPRKKALVPGISPVVERRPPPPRSQPPGT
jgi:hypothetical protein